MPEPDPARIKSFASPIELNRWLQANHAVESELWVKVYKKGTGVPSITWDQIVIETLCWGWIDGIRKSLDDNSFLQLITPRKGRSNWSKKNTEHVERLIAENRMEEPGLVHVRAAKADGRWTNAYASASEMTIPADFLTALESRPEAKRRFETLNKSSRYSIVYGLATAKSQRPDSVDSRSFWTCWRVTRSPVSALRKTIKLSRTPHLIASDHC